MRPVNKGSAPDVVFRSYQDAEPFLENRIGLYCSYCELHLQHMPEVEHKEARAGGGEELQWENLLLSCKYCNARKGARAKAGDLDQYLWPDRDDTFHAYSYKGMVPSLNREYLAEQGDDVRDKADRLYRLLKLDNVPVKPSDKDRRFLARNEARNCAIECKKAREKVKEQSEKESVLELIILLAKESGFFSVWMEIFKDDEEVRKRLASAFPGTRKDYIS